MADMSELRERIDRLDHALISVIAERLAVCREVAALKETTDMPVIQPARVRDVLTSRRQQAIEAGVDADFAEELFRVLLTETHRIEVAGKRADEAPHKAAAGNGASDLDTVASRIDHIVVAVRDLTAARGALIERFGFHDVAPADGVGGDAAAADGVAVVAAGGVTVVLVGAEASPAVRRYVDRHGDGVQHVAVEVLNAQHARAALARAGAPLLTEVVVDVDGHEQFFAAADPATGLQLGFISRTGHRVGLGAANVLQLFETLTDE